MANDAVLRSSLICLAAVILVVGISTQSFKKMVATYVVGVLGIAGVILPDWAYFNRDFSRWTSPITTEERAAQIAQRSGSKRLVSDWLLRRFLFFFFFGRIKALFIYFLNNMLCLVGEKTWENRERKSRLLCLRLSSFSTNVQTFA
jgi:hypothetical protein